MGHDLRTPVPFSRQGWTWPFQVRSYFDTNGASDPVTFSGDILSVTRVNSGGTQPLYRVLYKDDAARPNRTACDGVSMMQVAEERYQPRIITGETGVDYQRVVDVQVWDDVAGAFTNSVAAGRRVVLSLWDEGFNAS